MYRDADQRNFARQLRNQPTEAEKTLWQFLRAEQLNGHKFRRQAALGPYVVDFICFSQKLVIELDGPQHCEKDAEQYDAQRTAWLASRGYRVIRFRNHQLDENIHAVVDEISRALTTAKPNTPPTPSPTLPSRGREPEE
jgi:adenine-specific DNA-methyltransferase